MPTYTGGTICLREWERRAVEYHEKLDEFFDSLPIAMRTLIEDVPTKGATVVRYGVANAASFKLTIQLAGGQQFLLTYDLTAMPTVKRSQGTYPRLYSQGQWLYDEVTETEEGFAHTIMLSDGRAIVIPFKDMRIKRVEQDAKVHEQRGVSAVCV